MCHTYTTHIYTHTDQKLYRYWKTRKMSEFFKFLWMRKKRNKIDIFKSTITCPDFDMPDTWPTISFGSCWDIERPPGVVQPACAQTRILSGFRIVSFVQSYYPKLRACVKEESESGPGTNARPHLLSVLRGIVDFFCSQLHAWTSWERINKTKPLIDTYLRSTLTEWRYCLNKNINLYEEEKRIITIIYFLKEFFYIKFL